MDASMTDGECKWQCVCDILAMDGGKPFYRKWWIDCTSAGAAYSSFMGRKVRLVPLRTKNWPLPK